MPVLAILPARYGSTRFPGKPLVPIAGRPMIQHVWERTRKAAGVDAVVIATDDERIRAACEAFGAEVVMTAADHPTGTDRLAEVAQQRPGYEVVVNVQGDEPLLLQRAPERARPARPEHEHRAAPSDRGRPTARHDFADSTPAPRRKESQRGANRGEAMFDDEVDLPVHQRALRGARSNEQGMQTFRVDVGHQHGVKPGNLVGAIANEAGIESRYIGRIDIREDFSLLDLPEGVSADLLDHLKSVWVAGQRLKIRPASEKDFEAASKPLTRGKRFAGPRADTRGGKPAGKPGGKPGGKSGSRPPTRRKP